MSRVSDGPSGSSSGSFSQGKTHVSVTRPEGFLLRVEVLSKIDLPPSSVFGILVDSENGHIFRNHQRTTYRKVLFNDGNKQRIEVEQVTGIKFLFFRSSFSTRLIVDQDVKNKTLARPGIMKDFKGSWKIEPFTERGYQDALKRSTAAQSQLQKRPSAAETTGAAGTAGRLHAPWLSTSMFANLHPPEIHLPKLPPLPSFLGGARQDQSSLVILSQSLAPAAAPPPLDRLLTGMSVRVVKTILEDLQIEAERRNKDKSNATSSKGTLIQR